METLFYVLTSVGRDFAADCPRHLSAITHLLRDAFLQEQQQQQQLGGGGSGSLVAPRAAQQVKTTLLQLIELHAATWQLPASAVRYYYPAAAKPAITTAL